MKTLEFDPGPDTVLEEQPDGMVKVRRKVCFLSEPEGVRISTVSSPANGMPFTALKATAATTPDEPAGGGATAAGTEKTVDEKQQKVALLDSLKRFLGLADITDPGKVEAVAGKASMAPTSIAQVEAREQFWESFWSLRRAFQDVVDGAIYDQLPAGTDPAAVITSASSEFTGRVAALVAQAKSAGLFTAAKATEDAATAAKIEMSEGVCALGLKVQAEALAASKAGKVLSASNLALVQQAAEALAALLAVAQAQPAAGAGAGASEEAQPGAAGAEAGAVKAAGAPGPEERAMKDQSVKAALDALKAGDTTKAQALLAEAIKEADKAAGCATDGKAAGDQPVMPPGVMTEEKAEKRFQAIEAGFTTKFAELEEHLVGALKAITGLENPADPEGARLAKTVTGAQTPDGAATDPATFRYAAPAGNPFDGSVVSVPGNASVPAGAPSTKSLEDRLAALEQIAGARPAAKATGNDGQPEGGGEAWGASFLG